MLRAWGGGDRGALETVMPLVYRHLQATAHSYMVRQGPGQLLQSAALVNETYLRLIRLKEIEWQDRDHFYAVCAQLLRQVLTDYARSRLRLKRGGRAEQLSLEEAYGLAGGNPEKELLAVDHLLQQLSAFDERMSQIVQYRVFMGATVEETAAALGISDRTVKREWVTAKAWLAREMERRKPHGP